MTPCSKCSELRAVLDLLEEAPDLGRAEATMPTERADRRDLARTGPTGDGLRVHPEHRRHLRRCEQRVLVRRSLHGSSLSRLDAPRADANRSSPPRPAQDLTKGVTLPVRFVQPAYRLGEPWFDSAIVSMRSLRR